MSTRKQIQHCFAFTQADLDANILGQYSKKQKKRYEGLDLAVSWFWFLTGVVFVGLGSWRVSVLVRVSETRQSWALPFVAIVLGLWFMCSAFREVDTSIKRVEGEVVFFRHEPGRSQLKDQEITQPRLVRTMMQVGDEVFDAVDPMLRKHMEGRRFAVYYMAGTKDVLSVEEVGV